MSPAAATRNALSPSGPPERWTPGDAWPFDAFPSKALAGYTAAERRDPFWTGSWQTSGNWKSATLVELRRGSSTRTGASQLQVRVDTTEAIRRVADGEVSRDLLNLLGLVHCHRTLTTEQIVALSRNPDFISPRSIAAQVAFGLGIVETAAYDPDSARWEPGNGVFRPCRPDLFASRVEPHLTYPEWMAVTGGLPWSAHGLADRHNILTTELVLRSAEYLDIGTIVGERLSTEDGYVGTGVGRVPIDSQQSADATIVRRDGLRIAVEVTATSGRSLTSKVRAWVKRLSEVDLANSGLVVLFVAVPPPNEVASNFHRTRSALYQTVRAELRRNPPSPTNPFHERIAIASWREWFPGPHQVDADRFFNLRVDRPTAFGFEDIWAEADLLDPDVLAFRPGPSFDPRAILDNAAGLAQTPPWLREGWDPPEHWRWLLHDPVTGRRLENDLADILELYDDPVTPRPGVVQKRQPPLRLRGQFDPVSRTPDRWLGDR